MRTRYPILILLFSFYCSAAYGKENKDLIRADFYYAHYAYYEAIPYYEKVAAQENSPEIYAHLADCYSVTNNLQKAADAYAKAVSIPGCSSAIVLRYGQVLMQLMQYDEAEKWLKKYSETAPTDRRVANMIAGCAVSKLMTDDVPMGIATLLPFNTDGSDFAPAMWKDRLVFASDTVIDLKKKTDKGTGRAYYNIYSVKCDEHGKCDTEFTALSDTRKVNIKYHNGPATFTRDGKGMYFTRSRFNDNFFSRSSVSNKDSVVILEIMIASDFDTAGKTFKKITPFAYNNAAYSVAHPSVRPDGKMLVFSSNMPKGNGGSDLYMCLKIGDGWGQPVNVGQVINTEGEEVFPYWGDDATLYFSSDGHKGMGGLDIYKCGWNESAGTFSEPQQMGMPLNSSYDDISMAVFPGGSAYLSSTRPAERGSDNVFFYKKQVIYLLLTVIDSVTRQPLPDAKVLLGANKDNKDGLTNASGQYFTRLYPAEQYNISAKKNFYPSKQISLTATSTKETDTLYRTIELVRPAPQRIDSLPPLVKTKNVMDTPGIQVFERGAIYQVGHFHYAYDKYELTSAHKVFLDTMMVMLTRHPTMRIQVRSHTDCRGSEAYNEVLSRNRALSVVKYLIKNGVSAKRLEYVGLGGSDPTVPCPDCLSCTEEEHYLNRILDFKVLEL